VVEIVRLRKELGNLRLLPLPAILEGLYTTPQEQFVRSQNAIRV
jgi:hypothetical protein